MFRVIVGAEKCKLVHLHIFIRVLSLTKGTNVLVRSDIARLQAEISKILSGEKKNFTPIPLWDGHAAERIADVILRAF